MSESAIEKAVCDFARANGCITIKNNGSGSIGKPDRLFLRGGKILWVEFKAPGKRPTPLQERWLRLLTEQGFHAYWVDHAAAGIRLIEDTLL